MEAERLLQRIKLRLRNNDQLSDTELFEYIDETVQKVLNYTNLKELPEQLDYVVINIVVDYAKYAIASDNQNKQQGDISLQDISSIAIGDTSINLGVNNMSSASKRELKSHISNLDDVFFNYRQQLNSFRRMKW